MNDFSDIRFLLNDKDRQALDQFMRDLRRCILDGHDLKTAFSIIQASSKAGWQVESLSSIVARTHRTAFRPHLFSTTFPGTLFDKIQKAYRENNDEYKVRVLGEFPVKKERAKL